MCCCCWQGESLDPTQTQGGPDSFVSGNLSRQQLAEKEEKFKVRLAPARAAAIVINLVEALVEAFILEYAPGFKRARIAGPLAGHVSNSGWAAALCLVVLCLSSTLRTTWFSCLASAVHCCQSHSTGCQATT
jgi:hypothetical protein